MHMVVTSVWFIIKLKEFFPSPSKKGTMVIELLMQAISATAHSSLFFE